MPADPQLTNLIHHGRDREAAEFATREVPAPPTPIEQLDAILPLLTELVASLDSGQLAAPTSCAKFAVADVIEHMVGGATMFAAAFRGEAPPDASSESDLVARFPVAMGELHDAVHSPGALDRTIGSPFGDMPGDAFARFVALDGLVHGWDIATAAGLAYDPPAAVVDAVSAFAHQAIAENMRDGDTFAVAVEPAAGASALVRLVAFTGRQV